MKKIKLRKMFKLKDAALLLFSCVLCLILSACSSSEKGQTAKNKIAIVTTTNIYADIARNVVGKYGTATAIITSSSQDPHDFEPKTNDAKLVSNAQLVIANGLGYDDWMNHLASATDKKVVTVGETIMHLPKGSNPHIWYDLGMPAKYVNYLVKRLSKLDQKHAAYYRENGRTYLQKAAKIKQIAHKITALKQKTVLVSEPVFDYALKTTGFKIGNPKFEQAIQNETDPSPADLVQMKDQIKQHKVAFFVNNEQEESATVDNFLKQVKKEQIPVLSVRETMPNKTTYLAWMTQNYQKLLQAAKASQEG